MFETVLSETVSGPFRYSPWEGAAPGPRLVWARGFRVQGGDIWGAPFCLPYDICVVPFLRVYLLSVKTGSFRAAGASRRDVIGKIDAWLPRDLGSLGKGDVYLATDLGPSTPVV